MANECYIALKKKKKCKLKIELDFFPPRYYWIKYEKVKPF